MPSPSGDGSISKTKKAGFSPLHCFGGAEQTTFEAGIQPEFGPSVPLFSSVTEYHVTFPSTSVLASFMISFVPAGGVFIKCEVVDGS